jgi:hypothetical protein
MAGVNTDMAWLEANVTTVVSPASMLPWLSVSLLQGLNQRQATEPIKEPVRTAAGITNCQGQAAD